MKQPNFDDLAVRAAIDDCLSGLENMPSQRAAILYRVKGEQKVKRKFSIGVALALICVLMMGVAVAAGLGLFERLTGADEDVRLGDLGVVSDTVSAEFVTDEGVHITIDQAYYDGTRVFLSYRLTGPVHELETGEGAPEVDEWDWEQPGVFYGRDVSHPETSYGDAMRQHLTGESPAWARVKTTGTLDGVDLADGSYCDIIGGTCYEQADGSIIGWKECTVPPEAAGDEITVRLGVYRNDTLYYQDETGFYTKNMAENRKRYYYDFPVRKDTTVQALSGAASGEDWNATAAFTLSKIDLRGEVTVACPQAWNDLWWYDNDSGEASEADSILEWVLYLDGAPMEGYNLDGSTGGVTNGQMTYGVCYSIYGKTGAFKLVPIFRLSGAKPELGIDLQLTQ